MNPPSTPGKAVWVRWLIFTLPLPVFAIGLALFSGRFADSIPLVERPVILLILLLCVAGIFYFLMSEQLRLIRLPRWGWWSVLAAGLFMRLVMLDATPILEDDYHRYLWDGAVTAHGENPYRHSPDEIARGLNNETSPLPPEIIDLGRQGRSTLGKINHSYLRTIYPPLSQAFFALGHWLAPWDIRGWRVVLLLIDLLVMALLVAILKHLGQPPEWVAVYWLNPLLIREVFNSGHMEVLIFPFLLGAVWLLLKNRNLSAMALLALAAAVKIWPALLALLFLRSMGKRRDQIVGAGVFTLILGGLLLPQLLAGLDSQAGISAYARQWELNDSLFRLGAWISTQILPVMGMHPGHSQAVTRVAAALFLVGWTLYWSRKTAGQPQETIRRSVLIIAALFFVSPTQFPWYSLWMLPLLALWPSRSLLLLTVFMPLYYLRYHFEAMGQEQLFDHYLVWIEYLPVWLAIWMEWRQSRRKKMMITPNLIWSQEK